MLEQKLQEAISKAFASLYDYQLNSDQIGLHPTRKEFEGSYTFVVFPYLKVAKGKPEEVGAQIGEWLKENLDFIKAFNVVKGFLNLEVTDQSWTKELHTIAVDESYIKLPANGQKVMVEFSSPNTNKPLHLGHLRNNFLGDSASRILAANGYDVKKVNLVNDRGVHICKSMLAYQKMGNGETPESSGLKGDHLIGKYYVKFDQLYKEEINTLVHQGLDPEKAKKEAPSIKEAQEMLQKWENGDKETVELWETMNNWVYEGFDKTYETMGIHFDTMYKESNTYLLGKELVEEGLKKGVFFKKENGSVWVDLTDEGMDEKLVLRADGTAVYMTQDMGTCDMKHQDFPFDKSVFVVGNEQDYHFKVLFAIMKKIGRTYAEGLYHLSYGMVDLPTGKMKSREGTVVDADDLLQEMFDTAERHTKELGKIEGMEPSEAQELYRMLGLGALKYFLLKVDPKKRMLFNPQESIEFQGHTGPFVQYTHARISAILRRAKSLEVDTSFDTEKVGDLSKREVDLIYKITEYKKALQEAAKELSPAIIAQYVYDLAKEYNGFYQEVPIFNEENKDKLGFRIALSSVTAKLIKESMSLLGIEVPERM
ncbi:arginyl-tRNA synthetase [Ekhidna lutea]|uniref:Arginine--tRNA ligase n=1 Tax=Ekhidna lutea TaxID=447679 RepID=A0A239HZ99_EKHLU|nr:arginine--tRNA ligase [Ekhidna lutea]SNS85564.1 arginyl-tRNA synthetase [Ekhidna lutea]